MNKQLKIGLFGFGCVGQGLYDIFKHTEHFNALIKKIGVKNRNKSRSIPSDYFTYDKYEILDDPEVNCIVELIDDADEAYSIVREALLRGKDVVSANKKMLAYHLPELVELQKKGNAGLLYEGSCCGSIPIIRNLEEYYDHEPLLSISGIFNGSSNYILSKIFNQHLGYQEALKEAQDLGFAESNPQLDVGGFDAKFKLVILTAHSFGEIIEPDAVFNAGIENLSADDVNFAKEKNFKIKLVAKAYRLDNAALSLSVLPHFVENADFLYTVENEFNAVKVETTYADKQNFYGKGAGGHPTGAAVLSDISALGYNYRYEYKKYRQQVSVGLSNEEEVEIYMRYHDPELPNKLGFSEIIQRFEGGQYLFVIGVISMKKLKENYVLIQEDKAFLASTSMVDIKGRKPPLKARKEASLSQDIQ